MKKVIINYTNTATNIRVKMNELNVTKKDLKEALELKTNFKINKILKGEVLPTLKELVALCNLFDVQVNDLIDYCILEE